MQKMDYELIDTGGEEKLERFGAYILRRPDPQALWDKAKPDLWQEAHARYERKGEKGLWHLSDTVPEEWSITYSGLTFFIRPTSFKHVGLFPEQASNWEWTERVLAGKQNPSILNLFAYTGGATLAAIRAGATVTHVDASKVAVEWAKKNAAASGFESAPVRWIVDDVMKFVGREIKRGVRYDAVILDPPSFGHGPNDELWKIEEDLPRLMHTLQALLVPNPVFVLMNGYASGYSHLAFEHMLRPLLKDGGSIEGGELVIPESDSVRLMPAGIYARYRGATA